MSEVNSILYSRSGCCLCEGLENRLKRLPLQKLIPPSRLSIIDIDGLHVSKLDRERYDLQVPVICVALKKSKKIFELPRVSPRLNDDGLFKWLQKTLTKTLESG